MTALLPTLAVLQASPFPWRFADSLLDSAGTTPAVNGVARLQSRLDAAAQFTTGLQNPLLTMMLALNTDPQRSPELNRRQQQVVALLTSNQDQGEMPFGDDDAVRLAVEMGQGGPRAVARAIATAALLTGGVIVVVDPLHGTVSLYLDPADDMPFAAWSAQDGERLAQWCATAGHFLAIRQVLDRCREGLTRLGRQLERLQRTNCPCCGTPHDA